MLQFDEAYYLAKNPDVAAAISGGHLSSALEHYKQNGFREGRDPHPFFDTFYYLETYPDVAAAGINPFDHFNDNGNSEGRAPNAFFNAAYYLEQNPDVAAAGIDPREHYLGYGGREGRDPGPAFDSAHYNQQNPDVVAAGLNPLAHYLAYGRDEGRVPHAQLGFYFTNVADKDDAGFSASGSGDFNGDGLNDVLLGATWADPGIEYNAGKTFVVFGSSDRFDSSLETTELGAGKGLIISGISGADFSGIAVSNAGDINGDGVDDILIGASGADTNGFGSSDSYVIYGTRLGFAEVLDLGSLDGSNGFVINGMDGSDHSGGSVAGLGDINGDKIDDFLIGATGPTLGGIWQAGETYVIFGGNQEFGSSFDLNDLNGANGFVLKGSLAGDYSGVSVSGAGDINGDGLNDILIGALGADPDQKYFAGKTYVVFGSETGFTPSIDLSDLNGSNGFVINGVDADDRSGATVSSAGDINGDGFADIIIGASNADDNGNTRVGEAYVVLGSGQGFSPSLELGSLNGQNGFVLKGLSALASTGRSVASAGDVNSDGIDDFLVGATGTNSNGKYGNGETYLIFGNTNGFDAVIDINSLNGINGYVLNGADQNEQSGRAATGIGDVNGDGFDDILIGAINRDQFLFGIDAGEAYIVFGGENLGRFDALDGTSDG
ncbi:hypothetical protein [Roseibium sp.]|uniref:hypothetical protein n=1 Tax=Roseibium sp. TaxID=1936156 RepID=UPI003B504995